MNIATGKTYHSREEAIADGVAAADLAYIVEAPARNGRQPAPRVTFSKRPFGQFKNARPVSIAETTR